MNKKSVKNKKSQTPQYIPKDLKAQLQQPGINRYRGIHRFRTQIAPQAFIECYREAFPYKVSLNDYFGPAFPKTTSALFSNKSPKTPTNGHREILWAISRAITFKEELSKFAELREQYENSTASGDTKLSIRILQEIENSFGKSIWLIQNKLGQAQIQDTSIIQDSPDEIIEKLKPYPLVQFISSFAKRRIEGTALKNQLVDELEKAEISKQFKIYLRAKCLDNTDSRADTVTHLLYFDSQASLIDHYESLIQVLTVASSDRILNEGELATSLRPAVARLQQATSDPRLTGPLATLGKAPKIEYTPEVIDRAKIIENYTLCNYAECVATSSEWLTKHPQDSSIRILRAKARAASGIEPEIGSTFLSNTDKNLVSIFKADDSFFIALHEILQISDRFFPLQWASLLKIGALYEVGHEEAKRSQMWQRDAYVRETYISPFTAMLLDSPADQEFLSTTELDQLFHFTKEVAKIAKGEHSDSDSPEARHLRYSARHDLYEGRYLSAAEKYIKAAKEDIGLFKIKSLGGASLAYALQGDFAKSVEVAVDAYFSNSNAPIALPLEVLVKLMDKPETWPNSIKLGILQEIHAQNTGETDLSHQRLAFESYCLENSITKPSDIAGKIAELGKESVIFFLEKVWRPEIMRQTLLYDNDNAIEEARIEACKVLIQIDPKNSRDYQEELAARIKQQEITKATALVESSRVYVDIEAIKRSLKGKIGKTYAQYKSTASQSQKPNDAVLDRLSDILNDTNIASLPTILSTLHVLDHKPTSDPTDLQFNVIFNEITKEFLQGDHGLNAYLSTRVRHGKLVDALRKPVADEHLVTQRTASGQYVKNKFWDQTIDPRKLEATLTVLESFSETFDNILKTVRDNLIQIQIVDSPLQKVDKSDGLFIYRSSQLERSLFRRYDSGFKDLEELINRCVDSLWEKTDFNLTQVQEELDGPVRSKLLANFDSLSSKLSELGSGYVPAPLSSAVARARTATQQALDVVISWFRRNEVYDRHDYDVDFPPRIAASMVLRTMSLPEAWGGPEINVTEETEKMPGRSLDGMVDIYYVLLENALKHSAQESLTPEVRIDINYSQDRFECSVISKAKKPTESQLAHLQEVRETLADPESRRLAQIEGRSGFRKIWMTLDNTLYRSPKLTFEHQEDGFFRVNIQFRTTTNEPSIR